MKLTITKWFVVSVLALLCLSTSALFAQGVTTAAINGKIKSINGEALPGANIVAVHSPSGTTYGTSSRADGSYNLAGLRVGGPYTVTASFVGYKRQNFEDINLQLSQNLTIDFSLAEEAVQAQEVVVTGIRSAILSADRTGAATNVSRDQIDKLPTISRSFEDYYKLSPLFASGSNAAGRNSKYNNIQIDGSNYNDLFGLGGTTPGSQSNVTPISLDAIEEFQIVISPYDVRQGGFTGAGINAITRSGTNSLRGSAFYYGRNESFVGKSPDALKKKLPEFTDYQTGFRVGAPIIENKLFFFGTGEITRYKAPLTRTFGNPTFGSNAFTVPEDSLNLLANHLKNTYGYDPGAWKTFHNERESDKIFLRFDYNLSESHKLTARWNYLNASDHNSPSRGRSATDIYSANGRYVIDNETHSVAVQLTSVFGNSASNELIAGYVRQLDKPTYIGNPFPSLYIRTSNQNAQDKSTQTLVLGAEQFRHYNELQQDVVEITDNFSYYLPGHTLTAGAKLELFKFRNLFIPGGFGVYTYNSIADFINNRRAVSYEYRYSATSNVTQEANWGANQIGFYLQDEWAVTSNFKLTAGIRFDVPSYPDKANYNVRVDTTFSKLGYDVGTNKPPKTTVNISPRLGFNWAVDDERNTQVRGGVGVFSGRFPAVWTSNQYSNTGVDFYTNTVIPASFVADPYNQPKSAVGTLPTAEVNLTDQNFKAPSILRANIAVDHNLPYNLLISVEGVYSKSQDEVFFKNINLKGLQSNGGLTPGGKLVGENREVWGTYSSSSRRFTAQRVNTAFTGVYLLTNTDKGENANLVLQLQRLNAPDGVYANLSYTLGSAKDVNSGVSAQARSSWRFNPTTGNPNEPVLTYATSDRRHRVFAAVSYRYDWGISGLATTIGLTYNGRSGQPFSYLVSGDVNGDGESDNDLAYIPSDANDIILMSSTASSATVLPKTDASYTSLFKYIDNEDYLKDAKGKMSERNGSREPWAGFVDLRINQEISTFSGQKVEFSLDILNVMNLINSDWGWSRSVPNQNAFLLTFHSLDPTTGRPRYFWSGTLSDPNVAGSLSSRWQAQFGVRYTF